MSTNLGLWGCCENLAGVLGGGALWENFEENVHAKSQADNIWVKNIKNLCILLENSAVGLGSSRKRCWSYIVSAFENTPKNLVLQEIMSFEHSNCIVKVSVKATCYHFTSWRILKETTKPVGPFGFMLLELTLSNLSVGKCAPMQATTRTWENFSNRGTKMILLSDELWLIANSSNSFANGSKSIIRNSLGLSKRSEIYII